MSGIIRSMLDNDLYKLTMQKAVLAHCPSVPVKYTFINRRPEGKFTDDFIYYFYRQLEEMSKLQLTDDEANWLCQRCPWLGIEYIAFLRGFRFDHNEVSAKLEDGELRLEIGGTWDRTILWEVPLMAIISELFFLYCDNNWKHDIEAQYTLARAKADKLEGIHWADFGTRRRRNFETQNVVVQAMANYETFFGTSNVYLAKQWGVRPIGTMAHEWIMGISALEGLRHANRYALRIWSQVYDGDLGIALTDTFGTKAFYEDFDGYLARLFDGVRHDSGDPIIFADNTIGHYQSLGIDPKTRVIVFTDGLTTDDALRIADYCKGRVRCSFGIGTHFTNDYEGSRPLNMVIKLAECNGVPVVKLSDVPSKAIGDRDAKRVAEWTFHNLPLDRIF